MTHQNSIGIDLTGCIPEDANQATLIGRVWTGGQVNGPSIVTIENEMVFDISRSFPVMSELLNSDNLKMALKGADRVEIGDLYAILKNSDPRHQNPDQPFFIAPCDLQVVKACGVTFANSMLERLVEENAKGNPVQAKKFRHDLESELNFDLSKVKPGSGKAFALKKALIKKNLWSQYLEVGIGPDAEVFSKAPPLASIGTGADLGIRCDSKWNNPEPEVALAVNCRGGIVGASLGNDVNLRDFEGRSALLLGKAKDNNASSVIGPFIRIFDDSFSLDDLRQAEVVVEVKGEDGFHMQDCSNMTKISRDVKDLVKQTLGKHHQYPDGVMLYTGTLFSPVHDRDHEGEGFTHKPGDVVKIASPRLGALINRVGYCHEVPPWQFGIVSLIRNLAGRGLV